jgi:hypothetical protein
MSRKQLHVWISDEDHEFLVGYVDQRDETVSVLMRRIIRQLRRSSALPSVSSSTSQQRIGSADNPTD